MAILRKPGSTYTATSFISEAHALLPEEARTRVRIRVPSEADRARIWKEFVRWDKAKKEGDAATVADACRRMCSYGCDSIENVWLYDPDTEECREIVFRRDADGLWHRDDWAQVDLQLMQDICAEVVTASRVDGFELKNLPLPSQLLPADGKADAEGSIASTVWGKEPSTPDVET